LQPGIANGPFPGGTSVASGITVQSNTLANPATLSPRGINGLTFAPTGTAGVSGNLQPSNQLSSNSNGDSFDIRFSVALGMVPRAVDLSPMYYRVGSANNTGTLTIRVFDSNNVLQGTTTVANVGDCLENGYIGIVLPTNLVLGRVNVSTGGTTDVSGADNIRVFGTPVPEPVGILGVIGIAAAIGRRQRPSCRSAV
jgi:hypothetical protein